MAVVHKLWRGSHSWRVAVVRVAERRPQTARKAVVAAERRVSSSPGGNESRPVAVLGAMAVVQWPEVNGAISVIPAKSTYTPLAMQRQERGSTLRSGKEAKAVPLQVRELPLAWTE